MSTLVKNASVISNTAVAVVTSVVQDLSQIDSFGIQAVYSDVTLGAKVFASSGIDTSADTLTLTAHGLTTGTVGQFTTSVTLPTGISALTNYFVIVVDANTIKIATSLANAVAGTAVDITGAGTGNQTFTSTALSGVLKLQASLDNSNWFDISGATSTITAAGSSLWTLDRPGFKFLKVLYTPTSGVLSLSVIACLRDSSIKRS